jgi:hypothetical protein
LLLEILAGSGRMSKEKLKAQWENNIAMYVKISDEKSFAGEKKIRNFSLIVQRKILLDKLRRILDKNYALKNFFKNFF